MMVMGQISEGRIMGQVHEPIHSWAGTMDLRAHLMCVFSWHVKHAFRILTTPFLGKVSCWVPEGHAMYAYLSSM